MNTGTKQILIVGLGGFLTFLVIRRIWPAGNGATGLKSGSTPASSKTKVAATPQQKQNAITALKAYTDAVKAGEKPAALDELNRMIVKEYGLKVYQDKASGEYFCTDLNGNPI